jgi:hypothetical protein
MCEDEDTISRVACCESEHCQPEEDSDAPAFPKQPCPECLTCYQPGYSMESTGFVKAAVDLISQLVLVSVAIQATLNPLTEIGPLGSSVAWTGPPPCKPANREVQKWHCARTV